MDSRYISLIQSNLTLESTINFKGGQAFKAPIAVHHDVAPSKEFKVETFDPRLAFLDKELVGKGKPGGQCFTVRSVAKAVI